MVCMALPYTCHDFESFFRPIITNRSGGIAVLILAVGKLSTMDMTEVNAMIGVHQAAGRHGPLA